jgi:hypothetical protein
MILAALFVILAATTLAARADTVTFFLTNQPRAPLQDRR